MKPHPRYYRIRFLLDLTKSLILPQIALSVALRYLNIHLTTFANVAVHLLFIPIYGNIRGYISSIQSDRDAKRLGAEKISCVQGKWPGNIDILLRLLKGLKEGYILGVFREMAEELESFTINTRVLWIDQIFTIDEQVVKYLLTGTGFELFGKGYWTQERMQSFLGDGIFNSDGDQWRLHRNIARPYFAKDRISDFEIFEAHSQTALSILSSHSNTSTPIDAQDLLGRFTLDSATEFLFGNCLHTLTKPLPVAFKAKLGPKGSMTEDSFGSFARAFEEIQVAISVRSRIGQNWPLAEMWTDKTAGSAKVIRDYLDGVVEEALKQKKQRANGKTAADDDPNIFLEHLTESSEDRKLITNQVINILVAGRDTTAALITFTLYFLAMHQDVLKRLRGEILSAIGSNGLPTYDSMRELKYLRAVLNESLRLFPPVPINARNPLSTSHGLAFPATPYSKKKQYVPPGSQIFYSSLIIQRRKDFWGEDADVFDPERWIDPEKVKKVTGNPFMFVPFHAGPRICLGQNFAYNEASYFLVRVLQRFNGLSLAPDAQPEGSLPLPEWKKGTGRQAFEQIWPGSSVTTFVKGGLWMRFHEAPIGE